MFPRKIQLIFKLNTLSGAILHENMSRPYAKSKDVDSKFVGEVWIWRKSESFKNKLFKQFIYIIILVNYMRGN